MKLYVDLDGEQPYLVTDDGEATYVDDLREEGRDTEILDKAILAAARPKVRSRDQWWRAADPEYDGSD